MLRALLKRRTLSRVAWCVVSYQKRDAASRRRNEHVKSLVLLVKSWDKRVLAAVTEARQKKCKTRSTWA